MVARIQITGLKKLNTFLIKLPNNLNKEMDNGNKRFMKNLQKNARMRAPKDTGALKESIVISKTKTKGKTNQWKLTVESPYGIFQETGFKPHSFFLPFDSAKLMGGRRYFVKNFTPFIGPALSATLQNLTPIMNNSINKAIKRSIR